MVKKCRLCGEDQDHGIRQNGKPQSRCKKCQREYSRRHYEANKNDHNRRRRINKINQHSAMREVIREAKNTPCMDCSNSYAYYVMHFDHRDPSTKKFAISNFTQGGVTMEALVEEMAKCDVVCANCHAERTWGGDKEQRG